MGTMTIYGTGQLSPKRFIADYVFPPSGGHTMLDVSVRGNVGYCAVQLGGTKQTVGAVVVLRKDGGDWNYKIISENDGPYYTACPAKILTRLSATENDFANQWRDECRQRAARSKRIKRGSVITLDSPVTFSDGVTESVFTCEYHWNAPRNRKVFRRKSDSALCTISNLSTLGYSVGGGT